MASSIKQQQLLLQQRKGKAVANKGAPAAAAEEKVVVAVRAAIREISKTAIVWALTHVVQPGGSIILLVVIPAQSSGIVSFPCNPVRPSQMQFSTFVVLRCCFGGLAIIVHPICTLVAQLNAYMGCHHWSLNYSVTMITEVAALCPVPSTSSGLSFEFCGSGLNALWFPSFRQEVLGLSSICGRLRKWP